MKSPFKFLDPYQLEDRDAFFGRESEIKELYNLVTKNRLTFVYGPSGTGKTSLVQCGLASRFGGVDWLPLFVRRGDDINASLRREVGKSLGEGQAGVRPPAPAASAGKSELPDAIGSLFNRYLRPVYLIFDQFEELFILGKPAEQQAFYDTIAELLDAELPCRLLFILREDYFGHLNQFEKAVPELYHRKLRVEPMSRDNLRAVITGSCKVFDIGFDDPRRSPELVMDNILADKSGIHMPYVQVYLHMLYQEMTKERQTSQRFSDTVIQKVGPITDVLGRFLQEQKTAISKTLQQDAAYREASMNTDAVSEVLDVFVSREGTKTPVGYHIASNGQLSLRGKAAQTLAVLPPALLSAILLELEKSRILRRSDDTLELAHDTLAALIDQQRSAELRQLRDIRQRIETGYSEHVDSKGAYFFDKGQLARIEPFLAKLALEPEQAAFLENSRVEGERLENAEKERAERELKLAEDKLTTEQKARKKQRYFTRLVAAVAVIALVALAWAFLQQIELKKATGKVVESILKDANAQIYHLRYDDAWNKIGDATQLGVRKTEIAGSLMEIAFYYTESGNMEKAKSATEHVVRLFEALSTAETIKNLDISNPQNAQQTLTATLKSLDPDRYAALLARYYPDMVTVEGGEAEIDGKKAPVSTFQIARTEATFWQFALYAAATGQKIENFSPSWGLDGDNPVVNVSWFDAAFYANWLSKRFNRDSVYYAVGNKRNSIWGEEYDVVINMAAKGFRLPTEIEWEFAARSGLQRDTFQYSGTNDNLGDYAWYIENSDTLGINRTHPVGAKLPNSIGLRDMSGNVWEWCGDWYEQYPATFPANYSGPEKGAYRVLRGGSWDSIAGFCRTAYRSLSYPDSRNGHYGFRLVFVP